MSMVVRMRNYGQMLSKSHHPVSPIDENHLLYGNFIGLQYAFTEGLDTEILSKSVAELTKQFPVLSGRYDNKSVNVSVAREAVTLSVQNDVSALNGVLTSREKPNYINEPNRRDVLRGRAPLSTFTLTELSDGGAIFGLAISHVLTDAAGYHLLMKHLADIYTAISSGKTLPECPFKTHLGAFEFGTSQSKSESLAKLKQRDLPKPIPIKGLLGTLIKSLIVKAMDKSIHHNPPVKVHFTPNEINRLKETVLEESGESWISTNVALCAHFTSIMTKLSYGADIKTKMQIGQLLDLRGRYFEADSEAQPNYVGNAILIHIDKATFPDGLQNTTRGALARYFKQRQGETTAEDVKERLDLLADCLRHGYTNPELDVKNPIISLNNQSKMAVYDVSFGRQHPARIIPQDVGDNIMFFPAPDGGIEIYIRDIVNPQGQQKLLTPEWQNQIFNF